MRRVVGGERGGSEERRGEKKERKKSGEGLESATLSVRKRFEASVTRGGARGITEHLSNGVSPSLEKKGKKREKVHTDVSKVRRSTAPVPPLSSFPLTDRPRSETERLKFQNYDAYVFIERGNISNDLNYSARSMSSEIRPKPGNIATRVKLAVERWRGKRVKATFARRSSPFYARVHIESCD